MRVMVLVRATKDSEAGTTPSTELLEAMGKYNEELVNARILAGEFGGLHPSSKGSAWPLTVRAVLSSTAQSRRRRSWSPVSGCGRSRTWPKRSSGSSAVPTRCLGRARSKSAPCSKRPTLATRLRPRLPNCTIGPGKRRPVSRLRRKFGLFQNEGTSKS